MQSVANHSPSVQFGSVLIHRNTANSPSNQFTVFYTDDGDSDLYYRENDGFAVRNYNGAATENWSKKCPITNPDPSGILTREKRTQSIVQLLALLHENLPNSTLRAFRDQPDLLTSFLTALSQKISTIRDKADLGIDPSQEYRYEQYTGKDYETIGTATIQL